MLAVHVMNRHLSDRAISQVIAALMLIAITVTAAILLYVFSIGLLGSLGSGGAQQIKEQLVMEGYYFAPNSPLILTIRNVGPSSANVAKADFFINGIAATMTGACAASTALAPTASCAATLALGSYSSLIAGASYALKIATPEGGVFSYPIIYGGGG